MLGICGVVNLHANPCGESLRVSPTSWTATKIKKNHEILLQLDAFERSVADRSLFPHPHHLRDRKKVLGDCIVFINL